MEQAIINVEGATTIETAAADGGQRSKAAADFFQTGI